MNKHPEESEQEVPGTRQAGPTNRMAVPVHSARFPPARPSVQLLSMPTVLRTALCVTYHDQSEAVPTAVDSWSSAELFSALGWEPFGQLRLVINQSNAGQNVERVRKRAAGACW